MGREKLREITKKLLREAGWYEGRDIGVSPVEESLIEQGYEIFEPVKAFLREFGMLDFKNIDGKKHTTSEIFTEFEKHDKYEYMEGLTEERLVIVGYLYDGYMPFFVSESGKIYNDYGKLGNDIYESMNTLIDIHNKKENKNYKSWTELGATFKHKE